MICISGKDELTLIDLLQLCIYFPKDVSFGKELHGLLQLLIDTNVRPRYVSMPITLHYKNYIEYVPNQAIF